MDVYQALADSLHKNQQPKKPTTTAGKKRAFLAAFRILANRQKAAEAAGIDRTTHYLWMRTDPDYKREMEAAEEIIGDTLEDEAIRRAYHGTQKPITVAGERELVTEYSDTLLIFALKRFKPEKYRERYDTRHANADGSTLPTWEEVVSAMRAARTRDLPAPPRQITDGGS